MSGDGHQDPFSARRPSVPRKGPESVSRRLNFDHALISLRSRAAGLPSHLDSLPLPAGWRCAAAGWLGGGCPPRRGYRPAPV